MNPDYLGKLFKQETGEKFSSYVAKVRIEAGGGEYFQAKTKNDLLAQAIREWLCLEDVQSVQDRSISI